jgi:hypothetical protein
MITTVDTRKGAEAITSDHWHVVHARFVGAAADLPFARSVTSEHDDRPSCIRAARTLVAQIRRDAGVVPEAERDQVFVRRPGFKSLKSASRRQRGRRRPDDDRA